MEIDVNSVVLATRVYAALRGRFFIAGKKADWENGNGVSSFWTASNISIALLAGQSS